MSFKLVEVLFNGLNNVNHKHNSTLIEYLDNNMRTIIIKGRVKFIFITVNNSNIDKYRNMGVVELPAIKVGKNITLGVPNIKREISKIISSNKIIAAPKSDEEVLNAYLANTIGNPDDDDDDAFEDMSNTLKENLDKEVQRRKLDSGDTYESTTPVQQNSDDDTLMINKLGINASNIPDVSFDDIDINDYLQQELNSN